MPWHVLLRQQLDASTDEPSSGWPAEWSAEHREIPGGRHLTWTATGPKLLIMPSLWCRTICSASTWPSWDPQMPELVA